MPEEKDLRGAGTKYVKIPHGISDDEINESVSAAYGCADTRLNVMLGYERMPLRRISDVKRKPGSFAVLLDGDPNIDVSGLDTDESDAPEAEEAVMSRRRKIGYFVLEVASGLVIAFICIAVLFSFFFRPVGVRGNSMEKTLQDGDWLLVRTWYSEPDYGDIVVVSQPNEFNESLVKRVIAVGGQKVDIDWDSGIVYVDDQPLRESYTNTLTTAHLPDEMTFPTRVPYGYVFVMGDNRNNSTDSRSESVGFIKNEYILGKAFMRIYPFGSFSLYDYE